MANNIDNGVCNWCGKEYNESDENWMHLEPMWQTLSEPIFCSWKCLKLYAELNEKENSKNGIVC